MQYMQLSNGDQQPLLSQLEAMPEFVTTAFGHLSPSDATKAGPEGTFSPVEQCWHLADLECEGYGKRIRRLLAEDDPLLPDFDGDRVAEERNYKSLSLADGIAAFQNARAQNIIALRRISTADWLRPGTQEGVGRMAMCDVPAMMSQHDEGHRLEIEMWIRAFHHLSGAG